MVLLLQTAPQIDSSNSTLSMRTERHERAINPAFARSSVQPVRACLATVRLAVRTCGAGR